MHLRVVTRNWARRNAQRGAQFNPQLRAVGRAVTLGCACSWAFSYEQLDAQYLQMGAQFGAELRSD